VQSVSSAAANPQSGSAGALAREKSNYRQARSLSFYAWLRVSLAQTFVLRARAPSLPVAPHTIRITFDPLSLTREGAIPKRSYPIPVSGHPILEKHYRNPVFGVHKPVPEQGTG